VIGVTVLTSTGPESLKDIGITSTLDQHVTALARLTHACGLDGVVASAREAGLIRSTVEDKTFVIVTPGIRPINATGDDQKRVTTFGDAIAEGSDFVVVGRPIIAAADPAEAAAEMMSEADYAH
jgi:orotidine-5'-phosphate decarboxylase